MPEVQSIATNNGIIFYGVGAGEWLTDSQGTYYNQNDYSNAGYYFIGTSDITSTRAIEVVDASPTSAKPATTFTERVQHELEQVTSPGEAGPMLLGEEFRYTNSRKFSLSTPGAVDGNARIICSFVSNLSGSGGQLRFTIDGKELDAVYADRISAKAAAVTYTAYTHAPHTHSTGHPAPLATAPWA